MAQMKPYITFGSDDDRYERLNLLGEGGFGAVYKARRKSDNKVVACKVMRADKTKVHSIITEFSNLWRVQHCRNVARWNDGFSVDLFSYETRMYMEYYPGGSLREVIQNPQPVSWLTAMGVFAGLLLALVDCHKHGIIHRDIKPENILVSKKIIGRTGAEYLIAHLADFGISKFSDSIIANQQPIQATFIGTLPYMAPESLDEQSFSRKSDMFSMACVIWELCSRSPAFQTHIRSRLPAIPPVARNWPPYSVDLMYDCMALNPNERKAPDELLLMLQRKITVTEFWSVVTEEGSKTNQPAEDEEGVEDSGLEDCNEDNDDIGDTFDKLLHAIIHGKVDTVKEVASPKLVRLLTAKEDELKDHELDLLNAQCKKYEINNRAGFLIFTLRKRCDDGLLLALLESGLDPNYLIVSPITDESATLLQTTISLGAESKVRLLLQYGADISKANNEGQNAIQYAKLHDPSGNMARLILDHGADSLDTVTARLERTSLAEESGKILRVLTGHNYSVSAIQFSPNGTLLASGGITDADIRIWDSQTGRLLQTLRGHEQEVCELEFHPNGRTLVSCSDFKRSFRSDESIRFWDIQTGKPLKVIPCAGVRTISISSTGEWMASSGDVHKIMIWNLGKMKIKKELRGHTDSVTSVQFSANGSLLASASKDKTVRLWDANKAQLIHVFSGHRDWVIKVRFSPGTTLLASAAIDYSVRVWSVHQRQLVKELSSPQVEGVDVAFSRTGLLLASGSKSNHNILLWDTKTLRLIKELKGHTDRAIKFSFSPSNTMLATCSTDRTIRLWDISKF